MLLSLKILAKDSWSLLTQRLVTTPLHSKGEAIIHLNGFQVRSHVLIDNNQGPETLVLMLQSRASSFDSNGGWREREGDSLSLDSGTLG